MTTTAIVLIPGFFGYAAFGSDAHPVLEYFGGVRACLQKHLPKGTGVNYRIVPHEPPPTGSLAERVASLDVAVGQLLEGEPLPHGGGAFKADRIHLVGHSTGGLDARLFADPTYQAAGVRSDRRDNVGALGSIVTLATPFYGTPVATYARADRDRLLQAIRVLTMLGVFSHGGVVKLGLQLLKVSVPSVLAHPGAVPKALLAPWSPEHVIRALSPFILRRAVTSHGKGAPALLLNPLFSCAAPATHADIAAQVARFFDDVETDRALLDDLTPEAMHHTNARLAEVRTGVGAVGNILSYVTVSPPPPLVPWGLEFIQRCVYGTLYQATARGVVDGPLPEGPSLGADPRPLMSEDTASDGVVPVHSQTLHGHATGIVLGDHLDVVGSFDGGHGANVMRSGSNFDRRRFEILWKDIAGHLV